MHSRHYFMPAMSGVVLLVGLLIAGKSSFADDGQESAATRNLLRSVTPVYSEPFAKLLCVQNIPGDCNPYSSALVVPPSFTVPAKTASGKNVKQLVVNFVSGSCVGTGRTTELLLNAEPNVPILLADSGDNFSENVVPMAVAQFNDMPGQNAVQAFAQRTQLVYLPGTVVSASYDAAMGGLMRCRAQLNGYFVTM
jgi:hypothetical protein